ncbi:hypothetical protein [Micromonospora qiuiae]|nr:hypothetical protein [Micromonospora qiuiae]
MAQAAYAPEPVPETGADVRPSGPSFDVLRWHDEPWTAREA